MVLIATLLALALCTAPVFAQQEETPVEPEWEPSKYYITKAHLLEMPQEEPGAFPHQLIGIFP